MGRVRLLCLVFGSASTRPRRCGHFEGRSSHRRVFAAVAVPAALELLTHAQPPQLQFDVGPGQPEHLSPAQAEGDREHEGDAFRLVVGRGHQGPGLGDGERVDLRGVVARRVREGHGVAREARSSARSTSYSSETVTAAA